MKKHLLLIAFLLYALAAEAQKEQICKVREQNSKRKPLDKVQVIFEDAPAAVSQSDGTVRLLFQSRKAGDWAFNVAVERAGYELVNEKEVEKVKLSADNQFGVDIILARAGVLDSVKAIYYGIANKALMAGFEQEKAKLLQKMDEQLYSSRQKVWPLDSLQGIFNIQKNNLYASTERFARINFDDKDIRYYQAFELFKKGKIDETIALLEQHDPLAQMLKFIAEDSLDPANEKQITLRRVAREQAQPRLLEDIRLLADMYNLQFTPSKAEAMYDKLVVLDSMDIEILSDASDLYKDNGKFYKSLHINSLIISHPRAEALQVADAYLNLGEAYNAYDDRHGGILFGFEKQFKIFEKLHHGDSICSFYKKRLAASYHKLGESYLSLTSYETAVAYFENEVRLLNELLGTYPENVKFINSLAIAYSKIDSAYTDWHRYTDALNYFEKEIELSKKLHDDYPRSMDFKNSLAIAYKRFGFFLWYAMHNPEEAKVYVQHCLDLSEELMKKFPDYEEFKRNVNWAENMLTKLEISIFLRPFFQRIEGTPDKLVRYQIYTELCDSLRLHVIRNGAFKTTLADILNNRAWTGILLKKFAAAEADIREGMTLDNENIYLPANLAPSLLLQGKQEDAMQEYKKWMDKPIELLDYSNYGEIFLNDLDILENEGIIPPEVLPGVEEVRKLLKK